jgi:hypothetical protein
MDEDFDVIVASTVDGVAEDGSTMDEDFDVIVASTVDGVAEDGSTMDEDVDVIVALDITTFVSVTIDNNSFVLVKLRKDCFNRFFGGDDIDTNGKIR